MTRTTALRTIEEFLRLGERPRVIAHRGFSGKAPENTLAALRAAIDVGADMVEIDVGMTREGIVMLMHDETLDRTTDGHGLLSATPYDDVRKLDAGGWFSPEYAGEQVPTLEEALDLVNGKILVNIEIKKEAVTDMVEGGVANKVLDLVRRVDMLDRVILSSFEPKALKHARRLEPRVKTASLYDPDVHRGMSPIQVMQDADSSGFNVSERRLSKKMIKECQRYGRPLSVYTANDEGTMRRLIAMGVHGLFTDHPDLLIGIVAGGSAAGYAGSDR
jgi:glycerophosphoryl diester phosphodiesterase